MKHTHIAIATAVIAALATSANCQPTELPVVKSAKVADSPAIDGVLTEPCWQRMPDANLFWHRETGTKATEETSAWICYDDKNIYVAFRCNDSQPDKIVAQQKKRGGSLRTDDYVTINIDPWHTHKTVFTFNVNPRGTQTESLPGSGGTKIEWIGDWHAAAKVTSDGWTAEMAIPWSILKYPKDQSTMSVSFLRRHARSDLIWASPNLGPSDDAFLMLDWTDVKPPAPKLQAIALGYTNVGVGGVSFKNGLDYKKQITQETNALVTINPDFDSVEQSVESIDFTYSPRVLTDNRPFFSEGDPHQDGEYRMFYSRNIEAVDVGAKIAGRAANEDFSALVTTSGGGDRHSFIKSKWEFGKANRFGIAATDTRRPGIENNVTSTFLTLGKKTDRRTDFWEYRLMQSSTPGRKDGAIVVTGAGGSGGPRQIGWGAWYQNVSPDYFAPDGIVTDPDLKGWDYHLNYGDEFEKGWMRGWSLNLEGIDWHLHSGDLLNHQLSLSADLWSLASYIHLAVADSSRRDESGTGDGSFSIYDDRIYTIGYNWNQLNMYRRGWLGVDFGHRVGGSSIHWQVKQALKIADGLSTDLSVEYLRMTGPLAKQERQSVATLNYDITSERSLSARLVERSGTFNISFGFRQAVRKGEDIYILFGDPNADKSVNRVIIKLIRPIF